MTISLSALEARRVAVASQGFGPKPTRPGIRQLRNLAARLNAFQIDSVNVLARAHYVPAFARLGPYRAEALDSLAYEKRELFEYWGHAACLLPIALYPLVRYRMEKRVGITREFMRTAADAYMARVYDEVAERGPLAAGDLSDAGKGTGKWWGWSPGKAALEQLFDAGLLAVAGRRRFERLYDLAERVIPRAALEAPPLPREEGMKQLICLGARAYGVGTRDDIVRYFNVDDWSDRAPPGPHWRNTKDDRRRDKPIAKRLVAELVEEGRLLPARVEGWTEDAYVHPDMRVPQRVDARGIVTPFDSLVWDRRRLARVFGMKYTIEMYTPAPKRVYGYYVCPALVGDEIVARLDLKADRERNMLVVQGAFLEPRQRATRVAAALADELRDMQTWLGLDRVAVGDRGDLARALRRAVRPRV